MVRCGRGGSHDRFSLMQAPHQLEDEQKKLCLDYFAGKGVGLWILPLGKLFKE